MICTSQSNYYRLLPVTARVCSIARHSESVSCATFPCCLPTTSLQAIIASVSIALCTQPRLDVAGNESERVRPREIDVALARTLCAVRSALEELLLPRWG